MGRPYGYFRPPAERPKDIPEAEGSEVDDLKALPPPAGILPPPDDAPMLAALSEMG